jgi:hypothetical protein
MNAFSCRVIGRKLVSLIAAVKLCKAYEIWPKTARRWLSYRTARLIVNAAVSAVNEASRMS